jgi:hypothetical protein
MFFLGRSLDDGGAAPDYQAAAAWYRRAVDAGGNLAGDAAANLSNMYMVRRCGLTMPPGWPRLVSAFKLSVGSGIDVSVSNPARPIRSVHFGDITDRPAGSPTWSRSLSK